jgi:hypothetical protein
VKRKKKKKTIHVLHTSHPQFGQHQTIATKQQHGLEFSTIASDQLSTKRDILCHECYVSCGLEYNAWTVNMAAEFREISRMYGQLPPIRYTLQ